MEIIECPCHSIYSDSAASFYLTNTYKNVCLYFPEREENLEKRGAYCGKSR